MYNVHNHIPLINNYPITVIKVNSDDKYVQGPLTVPTDFSK